MSPIAASTSSNSIKSDEDCHRKGSKLLTQCVAIESGLWHNALSQTLLFLKSVGGTRVEQYVDSMAKSGKPTKAAAKKKLPTVLEMIRQDSELKDFFKMVRENDFRDKAANLLAERIRQMQ